MFSFHGLKMERVVVGGGLRLITQLAPLHPSPSGAGLARPYSAPSGPMVLRLLSPGKSYSGFSTHPEPDCESLNAFVACDTRDHKHTAGFLLCDCCGQSVEIAIPAMPEIEASARATGFKVGHVTLEVRGLCHACQHEPEALNA